MEQLPQRDAASDIDIDEVKAFYDGVYHAGADADSADTMAAHHRGLFQRLGIASGSSVLDVACGTGGWLQVCADADCTVAGVDLSERAIEVCRTRMPKGRFHAQAAETLPFDDNEFDVVTCLGSLEHFVDPRGSLQEMVRVARPGATFVLLVPNSDFLTRRIGLFAGTYQVDAREVVRSLDEWDDLFTSAGLDTQERWKDLHVLNRHWVTLGPAYLWPLRLLQALMLAAWPLRWQYQVYHRCVAGTQ